MQNLLVIERSSIRGSWALYHDEIPVVSAPFEAGLPRAPTWYTDVIGGIRKAGIAPQELDTILVGTGPGSFSGIRAVLAAMQGLSLPRGIPVVGLASASAMALASALKYEVKTVAVIGDARRNTLWCSVYDVTDNGSVVIHGTKAPPTHKAEDFAIPHPEELAALIPHGALVISPEFSHIAPILRTLQGVQLVEDDVFPAADDLARLYLADRDAAVRDPLPVYLHPAVVTR